MAWCQATSHYLSLSWPRSLSPYGVTRPEWVNLIDSRQGEIFEQHSTRNLYCYHCMFLSKLSLAWLFQYAIWAMNIIIMIAEYVCSDANTPTQLWWLSTWVSDKWLREWNAWQLWLRCNHGVIINIFSVHITVCEGLTCCLWWGIHCSNLYMDFVKTDHVNRYI